jgi:hypothetical protein
VAGDVGEGGEDVGVGEVVKVLYGADHAVSFVGAFVRTGARPVWVGGFKGLRWRRKRASGCTGRRFCGGQAVAGGECGKQGQCEDEHDKSVIRRHIKAP